MTQKPYGYWRFRMIRGRARGESWYRLAFYSVRSRRAVADVERLLWRTFSPRIVQMLCSSCGDGETSREVRVSLPQMRAHRAEKCNSCEHQRRIFGIDFCALCKCVLPVKRSIAGAHCDEGKW